MALDLHRKYIDKKQESAPLVPIKDIINSKYYLDPLELLGERSFGEPREIAESEIGTPVQEFYRDGVILLTGGTGFMGKVLVEKLLRSCPHIKHIYLLIRTKKGKNTEQRLEDIFEDRVNIIAIYRYFYWVLWMERRSLTWIYTMLFIIFYVYTFSYRNSCSKDSTTDYLNREHFSKWRLNLWKLKYK